ncbi:mediator of RNA polymerase II transcription subunit 1 [Chironomus tepperi]|uniref:mediator of RNA polymerase II transcription subunit 1 n=1 Tax=Chironomus tepperi TaxID=113505 RepID=UPI00391F4268
MSTQAVDKNKQWRMESLMEILRAKQSQKTFLDLAKATRMSLLEKKYNIDAIEKQTLQTALDNLQNNITIKNRTQLVERLEMITRRQLSLKFTENSNTSSLFISSDMFYLEILLDPQSGIVNDVKVHHECLNESESEPHLVEVLRKGDFIDFTQQLEGFQSIYQLNCESKIKSKALIALQALENDLMNIYSMESMQNIPPELIILSSSVGLLTKRRGGHPMKLTFFVRPSELLNLEQKKMDTLLDALQNAATIKKNIGSSVTINLEAAAPSNKLQIMPLLIKNGKIDGNYNFQAITSTNSTMLPATFVLKLNKSFPISMNIVDQIKRITNLNVFEDIGSKAAVKVENHVGMDVQKESNSLLNQIISIESQGSYLNSQKGLFVSLTDQSHCYFISDNPDLTGFNLKSIQFTEPSHVTRIIKLLREQALFNALIASCVRPNSRQDLESCYMFEVNIVSLHFIQIFIEHPTKETMITVELDLTNVKQVCCKINGSDFQYDAKLENYINRVLQKTNSIPMVTRSLLKYWDNEANEARMQKRIFNNGIYGLADQKSNGASNTDKKDDLEKDDGSNDNDDSFSGNGQDSNAFDICGINKNEIFFKTNDSKGEKRMRTEENDVDIFDRKVGRIMGYDLDDENEEMMIPERNLLSDELMHNENSSISPCSSRSSESSAPNKKNVMMHQKSSSTPTPKSMIDVFEFNDPSPPHQLPIQSPKRIPTPKQSPSGGAFNPEKRIHDIEIIPLKNQRNVASPSLDASTPSPSMLGQTSITITPINNSNFFYKGSDKKSSTDEKSKSEKKKKRKREEGDMGSPAMVKKKSSDSLSSSPPKKSPSHMMGKPQASFKPLKSPLSESMIDPSSSPKVKHSMSKKVDDFPDVIDELAFLNNFDQAQQTMSPQAGLKNALLQSQAQANRKSSLNAVIDKLKSEIADTIMTPPSEKKGEYQIKSSGTSSDGIKITFNKTKKSSESKSPKHTGLKPGVQSGPASKKSSKNSSQKLLYQKSSSSSSLPSTNSSHPSPKSSSQSNKTSKKESSMSPFYSGNSSSSNDMLKNMLNLPSPTPRVDLMKSFQIPKLSARAKSDDKPLTDDQIHPRSAPTTPSHPMAPSPTMDMGQFGQLGQQQQKFFTSIQQQQQHKFMEQQRQKKLFKSASSEYLYDNPTGHSDGLSGMRGDAEFQAFLRAQNDMNMGMSMDTTGNGSQQINTNLFNDGDDGLNLDFIGSDI